MTNELKTLAQDKVEVQKDLRMIKPAISQILSTSDLPPAVTESVRALNSSKAEAIAYGRAGLIPCFRDIAAIRKAAADAQGIASQTREFDEGGSRNPNRYNEENVIRILFDEYE